MATGDKKPVVMEADRGVAGGVATLGDDGKLLGDQVPAYLAPLASPAFTGTPTINGVPAATVESFANPNLLDNPFFTVNQRGQTSYSGAYGTYTVDRWFITGATLSLTKTDSGISFTDTAGDVQIRQKIENGTLESGKPYTISAIVRASSACTLNLEMNSSNGYYAPKYVNVGTEYALVSNTFTADGGDSQIFCIADPNANVEYSIRCVKLEQGSVSTLSGDLAPNYTTELAKCQRYFYKPDRVILIRTPNTNSFTVNANFKTTMRTAPTVAYGAEITALVPGVTDSAKLSLQYAHIDGNGIGDGDFISFTPADAEIFQVKDGQFSFSADL